ncbi:selenium metabolism hydrolase [Desulfuribacillus stibiiarsenatis]|uniref:Selenium metabolism hydrolase n=1 Tax=Desulfuribacillus stibiiarsenatis TaxID=1390249 RepID=A0A1E5L289_9FIRM|nr:YgeY family selenium metabolism-linked hydrolase [Desulfuribacillus stibiiarsenatis]OEH84272.1 selenium metabolism hydrolase [Desulfuribacillus stibiiarsenatis]
MADAFASKMVDFCQRLIRIPSISGEEEEVAKCIATEMKTLGYDEIWIDKYGNVIGKIKGTGISADGSKPKSILFDGHIDTVPVSDTNQWTKKPYGGDIMDGKVYGRGATDMKGAVAAMVYAAGAIAQSGERPAGDIYVSGTVHEEIFEGIAFDNVLNETSPDVVVIGEATELKLNIGQRGRGEIAIYNYGKSAHSANPQVGINAVVKMYPIIQELEKLEPTVHPVLGKGIAVVTDIISTPYPGASVVPNQCRITIDRRLLVGETEESVIAQLQEVIDKAKAVDTEISAKVEFVRGEANCYTGEKMNGLRFFPGWLLDRNSETVLTAEKALQDSGLEAVINTYSFCTNGSQSAGVRGIDTIGFGPSRENLAHSVDEYIEISQLEGAMKGYIALAQAIAK